MAIERSLYGHLPDGRPVHRFGLRSDAGISVGLLDFGGILTDAHAPDRYGVPGPVVLSLGTVRAYVVDTRHVGALVGRFANRIRHGRFELDGQAFRVDVNDGAHHLHGGSLGFGRHLWRADAYTDGAAQAVRLETVSPDGDQGFPGTLRVRATYRLSADTLRLDWEATTDRPTPVNLTQHAYFQLSGTGSGRVDDHLLEVAASARLGVDDDLIPTGERIPVDGTRYDFRAPRTPDPALYDTYLILRDAPGPLAFAARLSHPASGRLLEVHTTEPGIQIYTGHPDGGITLETHGFPDAPHHADFPSVTLRPGTTFRSTTTYRFGIA